MRWLCIIIMTVVAVLAATTAHARQQVDECLDSANAVYAQYGQGKVWASWSGGRRHKCWYAAELSNHHTPTRKQLPVTPTVTEKHTSPTPARTIAATRPIIPIQVKTMTTFLDAWTPLGAARQFKVTSEEMQAVLAWLGTPTTNPWQALRQTYTVVVVERPNDSFDSRFNASHKPPTWQIVEHR
jgi:hypothetical protein